MTNRLTFRGRHFPCSDSFGGHHVSCLNLPRCSTRHYLVMEYVVGETLERKLQAAGGMLEGAAVVDVAIQALGALEYLHGLKPPIVYRDLKPSNVMITAEGRVKLVDFGTARHFQPQITATMIGTHGYAPPEQYSGKVEARSDLYALGAMMHHLVTGRDPSTVAPFSFPPVAQLNPALQPGSRDPDRPSPRV